MVRVHFPESYATPTRSYRGGLDAPDYDIPDGEAEGAIAAGVAVRVEQPIHQPAAEQRQKRKSQ
jgi:hypothetical protein